MFNKKITIELNEKIIELRATINEKDAVIEKKSDLAKTLNQKNQNLLGQVKTVESQNQNLKAENQDLKNQNQNLVKELEVLEMKIKNMEKIHKKEIDKYVKREERYEDIIREAEIVVEDLEAKIFGLNLALDKKKGIKEIEERIKELDSIIEEKEIRIEELDSEIEDNKICVVELKGDIIGLNGRKSVVVEEIERLEEELNVLAETVEDGKEMILVSNVFKNPYDYETSAEYQEKLDEIKAQQRRMVKEEKAVVCTTTWQINNSKTEGKKLTKKVSQLMLRAFVNDADNIIMKAKYTNIDKCKQDMLKSFEAVNKLSTTFNAEVTEEFLNLKLEELTLRFGWLEKKEEEKEELRRQQEILREQAKAEEEINARREQIAVEREHYNNELARLRGLDSDEAVERIEEIEEILEELDKQEEEIEYRTFHNKAGYVYIISNPSFEGQEMYKIGVTRRLDPQVRVDELGSASLPFRFGVHSFIFSEDAFALEHSLHTAFDDRRVNKINKHKEFFYVTLDEIKAEVEKHNPTAEFIDNVIVEDYVRSLEME